MARNGKKPRNGIITHGASPKSGGESCLQLRFDTDLIPEECPMQRIGGIRSAKSGIEISCYKPSQVFVIAIVVYDGLVVFWFDL
eukprot:4605679-Amphidinium_carterae.1